jgi:hypothetical protein
VQKFIIQQQLNHFPHLKLDRSSAILVGEYPMAEAKLGSLGARVIVDRGSRAHYGPDDLITGKVMLMYKPYTSLFKSGVPTADLFGPLKLEVALRGKIKIQVKRDREFSADYGMPLFRQGFNIFDGSFKAEVVSCLLNDAEHEGPTDCNA